ncbi:MAG TPA: hypothetical protein VK590_09180 [Saprospiraceae bacterium]|nr:hypothetical protein [Saprospiraceae bacterium]
MSLSLEERLIDICSALEKAQAEFNIATDCCVTAIEGMHQRMERVEKWIIDHENLIKD